MPPSSDHRVGPFALVVVLALLLVLWEAFLLPLRVAGVPLPVSLPLALVGNLVLGLAGGRLYGRAGAAVPGLIWFVVAVALQTRRPEGDLVITGGAIGLGFLLLGSLGAAVALGMTAPKAVVRAAT